MRYRVTLEIDLDEREIEKIAKDHVFHRDKLKWWKAIIEYLDDERHKTTDLKLEILK